MTSADSAASVLYSLSLRSIWVLLNDIPVAYGIFFCLLSRGKAMVKGLKNKTKQNKKTQTNWLNHAERKIKALALFI